MRLIIILLLFLLNLNVNSQENKVFEGKVINTEGNGIPYATIEFKSKKGGIACNEKGIYHWKIKNLNLKDTLVFRSMGYISKEVPINLIFDTLQSIVLQKKEFTINEVIVRYTKKTVIAGNNNKPKGAFGFITPGREIAIFIKDTNLINKQIKSISYFISNKAGIPNTPFRVRIYSFDKQTGLPGEDLLNNQIIVTPKKSGWINVQLNNEMRLPKNGVFVSMEYIYTDDKYYSINKSGTEFYGQYVGMSLNKTGICRTFVKEFGLGWLKKTSSKYDDVCIFIEVNE